MQLFLKVLSGVANNVDPDQTAPEGAVRSGSTLFAYAILSEILVYEVLGHSPYSLKLLLQQPRLVEFAIEQEF